MFLCKYMVHELGINKSIPFKITSSMNSFKIKVCALNVFLHIFFVFVYLVSDLHEEGKNAINAPMLPPGVDIHPEDTQLGIYSTQGTHSKGTHAPLKSRFMLSDRFKRSLREK